MKLQRKASEKQTAPSIPTESLVIPCFNEEGNIALLGESLKAITDERENLEIILVDNGSTDHTREEIERLVRTIPRLRMVCIENNIGYGNGIKAGLTSAIGLTVGWTHADLQTDPTDAVKAFDLCREHDNAYVKGKRVGRNWRDRFFSIGMALTASLIFRMRLSEINAQPTAFAASLKDKLIAGPDDFGFDLFAMVLARQEGLREFRLPVYFGERFAGRSSWNVSLHSRLRLIARTLSYCFRLSKEVRHSVDH